jgi:Flp pilus assembly protein TadD
MQQPIKHPDDDSGSPDDSSAAGLEANPPASRHWRWLFVLVLVAATVLAYVPALNGGFVWDDASWTLNLTRLFQNASGLWAIWVHPTALQQYYPLSATSFWLDYRFWKFWTLPYHVENVLLHALAAVLFWRLLLRLRMPGAGLAATLFALHPVMVESAAWITERKNVLSLVLCLAALLAYLRFARDVTDEEGQVTVEKEAVSATDALPFPSHATCHAALFYGLAFVLFLGALLAKTTAFSLPAVVLLLAWWRRGRLRWRADVLPTAPFFALAFGLCAVTAWMEKNHVGAHGPEFALTFAQRCLIAGQAFWFYLGKLFWPVHLCFVYPRWQPNPAVWWQWLYPVTAAGTLLALWLARKQIGRGPITALLFFVGTLFPLLGFMNAYGMRYSFVWDHWVYLSSLGPLALVAALVAERRRLSALVYGFAIVVLPVLGFLTWREAGTFANMETLWRTTLARNPRCSMAQSNLGNLLFDEGKPVEAEVYYREALQINPDYAEAHSNLGIALAAQGKAAEALWHFERAIELNPDYAEGHYNLAVALAAQRKFAEAMQHYERAIQLKPDYAEAYDNLGIALAMQGRLADAVQDFDRAAQLQPRFAEAHYDLALALTTQERWAEAIQHFERAVQLKPDYALAQFNLGIALAHEGKPEEAIPHWEQALNLATAQGNAVLAQAIRARLQAYQPSSSPPQMP